MCQFSANHKKSVIREGIKEIEKQLLSNVLTQLLDIREMLLTETNQDVVINDTPLTNMATSSTDLSIIMMAFLCASVTILLLTLF